MYTEYNRSIEIKLGLEKVLFHLVYKIPYHRARWAKRLLCPAFRPSARKQRYLAYKISSAWAVLFTLGCALFSKFLVLNAVLAELDELSSGVPSFLKFDHGKLLRIAILSLVTWVSRGTLYMRHGIVITTRYCARGDSMRNFIRELAVSSSILHLRGLR